MKKNICTIFFVILISITQISCAHPSAGSAVAAGILGLTAGVIIGANSTPPVQTTVVQYPTYTYPVVVEQPVVTETPIIVEKPVYVTPTPVTTVYYPPRPVLPPPPPRYWHRPPPPPPRHWHRPPPPPPPRPIHHSPPPPSPRGKMPRR